MKLYRVQASIRLYV